ncbi:hypothetical protein ACFQZO_10285 [Bradyrhizobium sp. GCM10027634]|uniref:hypothetical protein n=1 Tax=unclassified Bradyrhizobium TaxID=2631580 RepID=UPI00263B19CF|nr:hypothetical protein [Bradyrhizobium sp. WYCCWR 12677]MDN5001272.1 hypothetical protein [Bradyrhizobium sp. WYCCWR 12677]
MAVAVEVAVEVEVEVEVEVLEAEPELVVAEMLVVSAAGLAREQELAPVHLVRDMAAAWGLDMVVQLLSVMARPRGMRCKRPFQARTLMAQFTALQVSALDMPCMRRLLASDMRCKLRFRIHKTVAPIMARRALLGGNSCCLGREALVYGAGCFVAVAARPSRAALEAEPAS